LLKEAKPAPTRTQIIENEKDLPGSILDQGFEKFDQLIRAEACPPRQS
jgi:hypothetical protein